MSDHHKESLRPAATGRDHGNCAWLDPHHFAPGFCPVCGRPILVPRRPVWSARVGGLLAGLLAAAALWAVLGG